MERNRQAHIIELIDEMAKMCDEHNTFIWGKVLRAHKEHFVDPNYDKLEAAREMIRSITGGMGSLGDVALHKDGWPLSKENKIFNNLRSQLFLECERMIAH